MSDLVNFFDYQRRDRLTDFEEFCVGHWGLYMKFHRVLRNGKLSHTERCQQVMEICRQSWNIPKEEQKYPPTLRCQAAQKIIEGMDVLKGINKNLEKQVKALKDTISLNKFHNQLNSSNQKCEIFKLEKENQMLKKKLDSLKDMSAEKIRKISEL